MIPVRCFTNLDEYKRETWPTELCAVPLVGHWVAARSGKKLRVVSITHREELRDFDESGEWASILDVELHR